MIEINLLPKEYSKKAVSLSFGKTGLYAVAALAGTVLVLVVVTFWQIHQLSSLEDNIAKAQRRAAMLEKDIQLVEALTDVKDKITSRMLAVERLDSHRSSWVRILQDIAANVPEFVWLGSFREEAGKDTVATHAAQPAKPQQPKTTRETVPTVRKAEVEGYAFTLNALAAFMIKMMRSDYFDEVELVSSDEVRFEDQKAYNFVLSCNLHYLSDEELRNLIARAEDHQSSQKGQATHKSLN